MENEKEVSNVCLVLFSQLRSYALISFITLLFSLIHSSSASPFTGPKHQHQKSTTDAFTHHKPNWRIPNPMSQLNDKNKKKRMRVHIGLPISKPDMLVDVVKLSHSCPCVAPIKYYGVWINNNNMLCVNWPPTHSRSPSLSACHWCLARDDWKSINEIDNSHTDYTLSLWRGCSFDLFIDSIETQIISFGIVWANHESLRTDKIAFDAESQWFSDLIYIRHFQYCHSAHMVAVKYALSVCVIFATNWNH